MLYQVAVTRRDPVRGEAFFAGRIHLFTGCTALIPLHAVYALMMSDAGVSTAQLSTLFVIWTITMSLFEVPAGAVADRLPRHLLLALAALAQALGFMLWVVFASLFAFGAGFVLWGLGTALRSGTLQALVYDTLTARGEADRYARISSTNGAIQTMAIAASSLLAPPLLLAGGYPAVGWVSVAFNLAAVPVALSLPDHRRTGAPTEVTALGSGYLSLLRAGVREAAVVPAVRNALVVIAFMTGLGVVDEYLPLQARESGIAVPAIPLVLFLPWTAMAVGGVAAGRWSRVRPGMVAVGLAAAATMFTVGALSRHMAGFLGIAGFYGVMRYTQVLADIRLQEWITGPARATVTSLGSFVAQTVALGVFGMFGLGSTVVRTSTLVAWLGVPVLALACLLPWLLSQHRSGADPPRPWTEPGAAVLRRESADGA